MTLARGDEQPAERRERLGVAEHALALLVLGKQLRQPRHRRDELHADADEDQAAEHEQLRQRRRKPGRAGRKRIEQDAEGQHAPAPQAVREIAAEQAEHAAGNRGTKNSVRAHST